MPSHSPYALYSLIGSNYIRIRDLFEIEVYPVHISTGYCTEKPFHIKMVIFLLPGFDILCLFLLSFSIIVLLCLVFKVQVKYWYISLRRSLCGRGLGFTASTFFRSQYDGWTIGVSDSLSQTDCSASLRESCCRSSDTSLFASQKAGGDEENRTPDPLLARQVLSQLSYTPKFRLILRSFEACINWELVRHSVPVSCCLIVFAHRHWLLALTCSRKWRFNRKNAAKKRLPNFCFAKVWWA